MRAQIVWLCGIVKFVVLFILNWKNLKSARACLTAAITLTNK